MSLKLCNPPGQCSMLHLLVGYSLVSSNTDSFSTFFRLGPLPYNHEHYLQAQPYCHIQVHSLFCIFLINFYVYVWNAYEWPNHVDNTVCKTTSRPASSSFKVLGFLQLLKNHALDNHLCATCIFLFFVSYCVASETSLLVVGTADDHCPAAIHGTTIKRRCMVNLEPMVALLQVLWRRNLTPNTTLRFQIKVRGEVS